MANNTVPFVRSIVNYSFDYTKDFMYTFLWNQGLTDYKMTVSETNILYMQLLLEMENEEVYRRINYMLL